MAIEVVHLVTSAVVGTSALTSRAVSIIPIVVSIVIFIIFVFLLILVLSATAAIGGTRPAKVVQVVNVGVDVIIEWHDVLDGVVAVPAISF